MDNLKKKMVFNGGPRQVEQRFLLKFYPLKFYLGTLVSSGTKIIGPTGAGTILTIGLKQVTIHSEKTSLAAMKPRNAGFPSLRIFMCASRFRLKVQTASRPLKRKETLSLGLVSYLRPKGIAIFSGENSLLKCICWPMGWVGLFIRISWKFVRLHETAWNYGTVILLHL